MTGVQEVLAVCHVVSVKRSFPSLSWCSWSLDFTLWSMIGRPASVPT
jgi:hypothetical protein